MDKIKFFPNDLNVQDKKVILRLDLNVPIKDKIIKDYTRIDLCLPFIKRLVEKKSSSSISSLKNLIFSINIISPSLR